MALWNGRGAGNRLRRNLSLTAAIALLALLGGNSTCEAGYVNYLRGLDPLNYWRLEEASGAAADLGSNNRPGTYGSAVVRRGDGVPHRGFLPSNYAAQFTTDADGNANNAGVSMGNYAPVTGAGARTILAWINPSDLSGVHAIVYYGSESNGDRFRLQTMGDRLALDVHTRFRLGSVPLQLDQWYLVGLTLPSGGRIHNAQLWINGQRDTGATSEGSGGMVSTGSNRPFLIGRHPGASFDFQGVIDEVAVFDRVLTATEMQQLYQSAFAAPEPGTLALAALGLIGCFAWQLRRRTAKRRR